MTFSQIDSGPKFMSAIIQLGMFGAAFCYAVATAGYLVEGKYWVALVAFCYIVAIIGLYMAGEN